MPELMAAARRAGLHTPAEKERLTSDEIERVLTLTRDPAPWVRQTGGDAGEASLHLRPRLARATRLVGPE